MRWRRSGEGVFRPMLGMGAARNGLGFGARATAPVGRPGPSGSPGRTGGKVKAVITSTGESLDSPVDPSFGRAAFSILVDTETNERRVVNNGIGRSAAGGAGVASAETVAGLGAEVVLTGDRMGFRPRRRGKRRWPGKGAMVWGVPLDGFRWLDPRPRSGKTSAQRTVGGFAVGAGVRQKVAG